eukprot:COSAG01_NODE_45795_length_406_cov_0.791531_1_plen_25_part_01
MRAAGDLAIGYGLEAIANEWTYIFR